MARQIIVLTQDTSHGPVNFQAAFWLAVPADRQAFYANASAQSQVKDGSVSAGELAAIQNGSVLEVVRSFGYPPGTGIPAIEADLQTQFTALQNALTTMTGDFAVPSYAHYGSFFDGTSWTIKSVT